MSTPIKYHISAGDKFGQWEVLSSKRVNRGCLPCQCQCGSERLVSAKKLALGKSKSCGYCTRSNQHHGNAANGRNTPTYASWVSMRRRCLSPTDKAFPRYGGRGIGICGRWSLFSNFLSDMGPRPNWLSLDRIDNEGNYEPKNCRWATATQQGRNRRTTLKITVAGHTKTVKEWSVISGVPYATIRDRAARGVPPEKAIAKAEGRQ